MRIPLDQTGITDQVTIIIIKVERTFLSKLNVPSAASWNNFPDPYDVSATTISDTHDDLIYVRSVLRVRAIRDSRLALQMLAYPKHDKDPHRQDEQR